MRGLGGPFGLLVLRGRTHDAPAARLFAAERRCDWRCFSAQPGHRVSPGIAGFGQLLQRPNSLALCRSSRARMRRYSRRSVVLLLASSYACRHWTSSSGLTGALCVIGVARLGLRCFAARGSAGIFCGLTLLFLIFRRVGSRVRSMVYWKSCLSAW